MNASALMFAVLCTLGVVNVSLAQSQPSLAEVARKEAERRKAGKAPTKVYTNEDVRKIAPTVPVTTAAPTSKPATPAVPAGAEPGAEAAKPAEPPEDPTRTEAYWRTRMAEAQDQLQRSRIFADALQSRINALTTDFVNRDDPYQREQVAKQRQEALAELDRVKRDIETATKAIADTEEDARRAGIPPGWLR